MPAKGQMVEGSGHIPSLALGVYLRAGHVHARQVGERRETPPQCHRPVKRRASSNRSVRSASGMDRTQMPVIPQLRGLQMGPQEMSVRECSLPSTPRSGHFGAHPYHPVQDVVEGSSYEFVPSTITHLHAPHFEIDVITHVV